MWFGKFDAGGQNLWCRACGYFPISFSDEDSDKIKLDTRVETFIHVPLAKGTYLPLTHSEYKHGISRGKTERHRLANERRSLKIRKSLKGAQMKSGDHSILNPKEMILASQMLETAAQVFSRMNCNDW